MQVVPDGQTIPQAPQFPLSEVRLTHTPLQLTSVPGQPVASVASLASLASVAVLASPASASVLASTTVGVVQTLDRQTSPVGQSAFVLHAPGTFASGAPPSGSGLVPWHAPETQTPPGAQSAFELQVALDAGP
jgi:hypothetical protein